MGVLRKHWDCQVFNLHHLQPPGGTSVPCCAFSCLLFGCMIFSICGTTCEEEGPARLELQQGSCPQSGRAFHLCCASVHDSVRKDVFFSFDRHLGAVVSFRTLHIHMLGVCSTDQVPLYMPQEAETCSLSACVPCCRATRWRFSFEALLLGRLHSPAVESLRLHTDPFRVNRLFDDHTVTAHGRPRPRARQGKAVEREMSTAALRIDWSARVADQSVILL